MDRHGFRLLASCLTGLPPFFYLAALCLAECPPAPRNVIVMIGDGMGYNHVLAGGYFAYGAATGQCYRSFPFQAAMATYPGTGNGYEPLSMWQDFSYAGVSPTSSSSAATSLSTGYKTYGDAIGVGYDRLPLEHFAERAKTFHRSAGVVTSVQFCHATPAAFAAHDIDRANLIAIAREMLLDTRLDVVMGCGHPDYDDDGVHVTTADYGFVGGEPCWQAVAAGQTAADLDGDGAPDNWLEDADGDGDRDPWTLITSEAGFAALAASASPPARVLGVARVHQTLQCRRSGSLEADPYAVPLLTTVPSLAQMSLGALNVLGRDPDGFFLMIEGGAIDWAANDLSRGRLIEEQVGFDEAVEAVVAWVDQHSDWEETLLIVTADHEAGHLWGPGAGGVPPAWVEPVDHGAGKLPGMEFYSDGHTNALVPLFARGAAAAALAPFADEHDPVRGAWLNNSEVGHCLFDFLPLPAEEIPAPDNIVVLVCDGCGPNHVAASSYYRAGALGSQAYASFPFQALMSTHAGSEDGFARADAHTDFAYVTERFTDTAAAATALSSRRKSPNGSIGLDMFGNPLDRLIDLAEELGKATGVVTSGGLGGPGASGLWAHHPDADDLSALSAEMLLDSRLDVLIGCGHPDFDQDGEPRGGADADYRHVGGPYCWSGLCAGAIDFDVDGDGEIDHRAQDADGDGTADAWTLVEERAAFQALASGGSAPARLLGIARVCDRLQYGRGGDLFADPYVVPLIEGVPTLAEMAGAALQALAGDPQGFLLFVNAASVHDASCDHAAGRMIEEMAGFDDAAAAVVAWVEGHSDWSRTLMIVMGAHESGYLTGPGSGGSPPQWHPLVNHGAGAVPGLEWHAATATNTLVPFYAAGEAANGIFTRYAEEYDGSNRFFLNNTEPAQACARLWRCAAMDPAAIAVLPSEGHGPAGNGEAAVALTFLTGDGNPGREAASLRFHLPCGSRVRLTIHDATGRRLATVLDGVRAAGDHRVVWNAGSLPAGLYFARLRAGSGQRTARLLLVD